MKTPFGYYIPIPVKGITCTLNILQSVPAFCIHYSVALPLCLVYRIYFALRLSFFSPQ